jgi:membrane protease YdiL (CAAX protease family)
MLFHCSSAGTSWVQDLAGYWRELLFWMLLLPAFGALGSIRTRGQIAGLIEAGAFLLVAISSTGKLKSLGLEFANWNRIGSSRAAAACVVAGLLAGGSIVAVASISQQPLGTENGWNKAMLAIVLGPVLEEVIFRGYLFTAALLLTRRLSPSRSAAFSIIGVALVFSIAHLTTAGTTALQLCCIVLTGCLYGWVRFRYRSTAAAALAHATYNLALYLSYWSGLSR